MLVLTRKVGESVDIELPTGTIKVTVLQVRGKQIKLGFKAPDDVDIWREEITPDGEEE